VPEQPDLSTGDAAESSSNPGRVEQQFSDSLLPLGDCAEFEWAHPEYAERIMRLKERSFEIALVENSHRFDRLDRVLSNQVLLSRLGLILGGVITLFVVGIGALMALQGKDLSNFSKIVVAAGVPAGVFIRGYQANQPNSPKR
jgi:hypothetical protein